MLSALVVSIEVSVRESAVSGLSIFSCLLFVQSCLITGVGMLWNVLLVDEHEVSRMGARLALGKSYFQVRADVSTFSEATSCLRDEEIDLVLLDLPLVKNRGFDLLEHIQRHYPDVPAVILTAHDNPTFIARAAILKATGYLMKNAPVNALCSQLVSMMADESLFLRCLLDFLSPHAKVRC